MPASPLRLVALRTTTSTSPTRSAGAVVAVFFVVAAGLDVLVVAGLTGALVALGLAAVVVAAGAVDDVLVVALAGVAVSGLSPRHT